MPNNTSQHQFKFFPLSNDAQLNICKLLELLLVHAAGKTTQKNLHMRTQIYKIVGDGNCLFRALAYCVCGTQKCHKKTRNKLTLCMYHYELELHPHIGCSVKEYLEKSKMRTDKVCGTDIELLVAAWLFKCDVFVYSQLGSQLKWSKYSSLRMGEGSGSIESIYLQNVNGTHYDVVTNVSDNGAIQEGLMNIESSISKDHQFLVPDDHDAFLCLRKRLAKFNLQSVEIQGDENCFFRSVSHQLFATDEFHDDIRAAGIKQIIENPENFIESITDESFIAYIKNMSTPGVWCDNIIIQAVSNAYNCEIIIHESAKNFQELTAIHPQICSSQEMPSQIHIGHIDEVHYVSTKHIKKCRSLEEKAKEMQNIRKNATYK